MEVLAAIGSVLTEKVLTERLARVQIAISDDNENKLESIASALQEFEDVVGLSADHRGVRRKLCVGMLDKGYMELAYYLMMNATIRENPEVAISDAIDQGYLELSWCRKFLTNSEIKALSRFQYDLMQVESKVKVAFGIEQ